MTLVIEVFRSDDYVPAGEIPLMPVLRAAFGEVIGPNASGVTWELHFHELADSTPDHGKPTLLNLRASHGFVRVRIRRNGELLYQHPHPVRELIGEPLRGLLSRRDPGVAHWGYGVRGPGLESIPVRRPVPQVMHEMQVPAGIRRRPRFTVDEIPEPEPPASSLAALGADIRPAVTGPMRVMLFQREPASRAVTQADADIAVEATAEIADPDPAGLAGAGTEAGSEPTEPLVPRGEQPAAAIAIPRSLVTSFVHAFPFSGEIEEGGFLTGKVYSDSERAGGYVIHVTAAIPAERTGASMLNFTFTGESFLRISERLASRGEGDTLLGWYHTHLFPATPRWGLSSVDIELHSSTFRRPWQVAALVNISDDGRVLRFYHGAGAAMAKISYWPVPS
jgi:proteasome lid subunit RPN8/RPN11